MTAKRTAVLIVLIAFSAFSAWVVWQHGYIAIFTNHFDHPTGLQVIIDLVIAVGLIILWMITDARKLGVTVWPFVVASLTLGSIGPLAYLFWREGKLEPNR